MSSKCYKVQKKKRWGGRGAEFSSDWLEKVASLRDVSTTCAELFRLGSVHLAYGEAGDLKGVTAALIQELGKEPTIDSLPVVHTLLELVVEIIFLDYTKPFHRQILSAVKRLHPACQGIVGSVVTARVQEEAEAFHAGGGWEGGDQDQVVLGQALLSLLWLPEFNQWIRPCCKAALQVMVECVDGILAAGATGSHVAPHLMQDVQDAISCIYHLVSTHGAEIAEAEEASKEQCCVSALAATARTMLHVLQGGLLVREALASAAAVIWVLAQLPSVPQEVAAAQIADGFFTTKEAHELGESIPLEGRRAIMNEELALECIASESVGQSLGCNAEPESHQHHLGVVEQNLRLESGAGLAHELQKASPVGRVCGLKGLATAMSLDALCAPLRCRTSDSDPWRAYSLLVDGMIKWAAHMVLKEQDGHLKFHAACLLSSAMQRMVEAWRRGCVVTLSGERGQDNDLKGKPGDFTSSSGSMPPLLTIEDRSLLMKVVWSNLEEPLSQTARQVHDTFDSLLELIPLQTKHEARDNAKSIIVEEAAFLEGACQQMLSVPYTRKGRYLPLSSLVKSFGSIKLLRMEPQLVHQTFQAMQEDMVASAASSFLRVLLLALQKEYPQARQKDPELHPDWRSWWLPQLVGTLCSASEKLRGYVATHALPVVLALDPSCAAAMLHLVLSEAAQGAPEPAPGTSHTAAIVLILRAARAAQLIGDLDKVVAVSQSRMEEGQPSSSPLMQMDLNKVLMGAIQHSCESIRIECLELACVNPKYSEAPGKLELKLISQWILLSLRNISVGQRNKCITVLSKLMQRIKVSVGAILHRATSGKGTVSQRHRASAASAAVIQQTHGFRLADNGGSKSIEDQLAKGRKQLALMEAFMHWTCKVLVSGLYPGGPYARKLMCVELLNTVLDCWMQPSAESMTMSVQESVGTRAITSLKDAHESLPAKGHSQQGKSARAQRQASPAADAAAAVATNHDSAGTGAGLQENPVTLSTSVSFQPFFLGFLGPHTVTLLLNGVIDSWDRLRQGASSALMKLPTPLPSLETAQQLRPLLLWASELLWSPRQRECDAAARMLKLIYDKYVIGLTWHVELSPNLVVSEPSSQSSEATQSSSLVSACMAFLNSLLKAVEDQLHIAAVDMAHACRRNLVHGPLLLVRYALGTLPWGTLLSTQLRQASQLSGAVEAAEHLRGWVDRLLSLLQQVVTLATPVLAHPVEGIGAEDVEEAADAEDGEDEGDEGLGPEAQVVMTACWTSLKEVGLVIGALVQDIPLPQQSPEESSGSSGHTSSDAQSVVTVQQLESMGCLLLQMLFKIKHSGAVEKAAMGLGSITGRMLRCSVPELSVLPSKWLEACLKRLSAQGQVRDDIIRRSAGLPFALGALFQAEPSNSPKSLLARAMSHLTIIADCAGKSTASHTTHHTITPGSGKISDVASGIDPTILERIQKALDIMNMQPSAAQSPIDTLTGILDAEPWPSVHAFNCLRHTFNDSNLAVDTSGYFAEGMQLCIRALGSRWWEVRNSATLCLTALVVRVVGFKNAGAAAAGQLGKKAITSTEFFQRFPTLHGFLLDELEHAAQTLTHSATNHQSTLLSPGLYPVLILLSRLQPGAVSMTSHPTSVHQHLQSPSSSFPHDSPDHTTAQQDESAATPQLLSPAAFIPLVQRCSSVAPMMAVRQLAAQALAPLVARGPHLLSVLKQLLRSLSINIATHSSSQATIRKPAIVFLSCRLSRNAMQSTLMQVQALIASYQSYCSAVQRSTDPLLWCKEVLYFTELCVENLLPVLHAFGPSTKQSCDAALSSAVLRAVSGILTFAIAAGQEACASVSALANTAAEQCNRLIQSTSSDFVSTEVQQSNPDWSNPMHCSMLREAAQLLTQQSLSCKHLVGSCIQEDAHESTTLSSGVTDLGSDIVKRLTICLQSTSYDVRAAAVKSMLVLLTDLQAASTQLTNIGSHQNPSPASPTSLASLLLPSGRSAELGMNLMSIMWTQAEREPVLKVRSLCLEALSLLQVVTEPASSRTNVTLQQEGSSIVNVPAALIPWDSMLNSGLDGLHQKLAVMRRLLEQARGIEAQAAALYCLGRGLGTVLANALGSNHRVVEEGTAVQGGSVNGGSSKGETITGGVGLGFMGSKERVQPQSLQTLSNLESHLEAYARDIATFIRPEQPEQLRGAALESLAASHLLDVHPSLLYCFQASESLGRSPSDEADDNKQQAAVGPGPNLLLSVWLSVLQLLEDEDLDLRSRAAVVAQSSLSHLLNKQIDCQKGFTSGQNSRREELLSEAGGVVDWEVVTAGGFVEVVIRQVLGLLHTVMGCFGGQEALQQMILDPSQALPEDLTPSASNTRRLFDRELDNQHEEPMLRVQLAALQLQQWLRLDDHYGGLKVSGAGVASWLLRAAGYLNSTAISLKHFFSDEYNLNNRTSVKDIALSGLAHNSSVFLHFYRCLLPFWAVSPQMYAKRCEEAGVFDLETELKIHAIKTSIAASLPALIQAVGSSSTGPLKSLLHGVERAWLHELDRNSEDTECDWPPLFLIQSVPRSIMLGVEALA
ncbi:hypothetical protein CEUSTIGMA_g10881.t1 [Chlamydomonas eustigma]|uniref:Uncharacterized protein n=1 Tax=Chlamydomonas eustigma TaxID=1157962 RepID=A0A250XKB0_9CHLO|nr:hypothetical protein CEUSTIGMA_g10881.t1 [Chlamydomonas eustigma]|eukprot:GAX83456.1 hypothetical protein CEUSTIGMA_g10881.t1 [Chlamydomonas eustigma]